MFGSYLIGLREGLEASLVVSILVAYLIKTDNRSRVSGVWCGVLVAVGASFAFGALLSFTSTTLLSTYRSQEAFGGWLSLIAVGFVTWMIFWMRRTGRHINAELTGRLDTAIAVGGLAIVLTAAIAVGREGLETALFFWSAVQAAGSTTSPVAGFSLGIFTAVVAAWLLYRRALSLNLARFFFWTGIGLIIVAAGVLSYGVHDLQEADILPGLGTIAFDVSEQVPSGTWYGTLLKGIFNFSPTTTIFQAVAYVAYVVPVMVLFVWGTSLKVKSSAASSRVVDRV